MFFTYSNSCRQVGGWSWRMTTQVGGWSWRMTTQVGGWPWRMTTQVGGWSWRMTTQVGRWSWRMTTHVGGWPWMLKMYDILVRFEHKVVFFFNNCYFTCELNRLFNHQQCEIKS